MTDSSVHADACVQRGFQLQGADDVAGAEAAYLQALDHCAEHPVALQLLGGLLRRRGDVVRAETMMRRSLQADATQPHVWNNLGNLLQSLSRLGEAEASFDQALALAPGFAEGHYNRARVLQQQGRSAQAAAASQQAFKYAPKPTAAMLQLQSQIEDSQGQPDAALATLDRALQLAPGRPALHHNRATLLQRQQQHSAALLAHEQAFALGLDHADAHYNHGNTLQSLYRPAEAAAAYRRSLQRQPGHALALYDLARLRWRLGDSDFDAELKLATSADPASAVAPGIHARLLWRGERYEDAACAYACAIERDPQAAELRDGLARCLSRQGHFGSSVLEHDRALALAPRDAQLRTSLATTLLMAGQPVPAQVQAEIACELAPDDQHAIAVLGLAWRLNADPREPWLNDVGRLVEVHELAPPRGFADLESFHAALVLELAALHLDHAAPLDQTLRHGTQTQGDIFEQGHPLVNALKARISQAVDDYIARLPQDASHPFLRRRRKAWRYTDSWSSRLGQGGFHTNHVHPHGWISSAYYVAVPDSTQDTTRCEGWLQFGEPDFEMGLGNAVRRRVQPRAGRLVLFPSMFWHGTSPIQEPATRLTIAFDVMPA